MRKNDRAAWDCLYTLHSFLRKILQTTKQTVVDVVGKELQPCWWLLICCTGPHWPASLNSYVHAFLEKKRHFQQLWKLQHICLLILSPHCKQYNGFQPLIVGGVGWPCYELPIKMYWVHCTQGPSNSHKTSRLFRSVGNTTKECFNALLRD